MTDALDLRNRDALFTDLEADTFDVLVIGAGITGAGIARDTAMRGLRTALVEMGDFASGTSSRSTKLVHGGLRYLAQGDIGLVREAASERMTVRRIAPHLAISQPFILPVHSFAESTKLRAGLWTYEKLGSVPEDERHESWNVKTLQDKEPLMKTGDLSGAVVYPEYLTDDARLTLANVRSALAHGATVANYAAVSGFVMENSQVTGAEITETLPGSTRQAVVRARVIVNASGPWADTVRHLEDSDAPKRLQLTKGIHLIVHQSRFPVKQSAIITAQDKRSMFIVPRGQFIYIGTTDTFYDEAEHWPVVTGADVDYLLTATNDFFDIKPLQREDVVSLWAGIRPLIAEPGKSPSEISRKDETMHGKRGVISIAGGKLTAYRQMAERIADLCEKRLNKPVSDCQTQEESLPGGNFTQSVDTLCETLITRGMSEDRALRLSRLYGDEAAAVLDKGGDAAAEAEQAVLYEGAMTLEDYWVRRSARAWFDVEGGLAALEPAAQRMAELHGWSDDEREAQIRACRERRDADLKVLEQ
ncbi:MAG: glycerol-3-phosphate dehydrogenase/oxidase [Pseudomonadota bacterium]